MRTVRRAGGGRSVDSARSCTHMRTHGHVNVRARARTHARTDGHLNAHARARARMGACAHGYGRTRKFVLAHVSALAFRCCLQYLPFGII